MTDQNKRPELRGEDLSRGKAIVHARAPVRDTHKSSLLDTHTLERHITDRLGSKSNATQILPIFVKISAQVRKLPREEQEHKMKEFLEIFHNASGQSLIGTIDLEGIKAKLNDHLQKMVMEIQSKKHQMEEVAKHENERSTDRQKLQELLAESPLKEMYQRLERLQRSYPEMFKGKYALDVLNEVIPNKDNLERALNTMYEHSIKMLMDSIQRKFKVNLELGIKDPNIRILYNELIISLNLHGKLNSENVTSLVYVKTILSNLNKYRLPKSKELAKKYVFGNFENLNKIKLFLSVSNQIEILRRDGSNPIRFKTLIDTFRELQKVSNNDKSIGDVIGIIREELPFEIHTQLLSGGASKSKLEIPAHLVTIYPNLSKINSLPTPQQELIKKYFNLRTKISDKNPRLVQIDQEFDSLFKTESYNMIRTFEPRINEVITKLELHAKVLAKKQPKGPISSEIHADVDHSKPELGSLPSSSHNGPENHPDSIGSPSPESVSQPLGASSNKTPSDGAGGTPSASVNPQLAQHQDRDGQSVDPTQDSEGNLDLGEDSDLPPIEPSADNGNGEHLRADDNDEDDDLFNAGRWPYKRRFSGISEMLKERFGNQGIYGHSIFESYDATLAEKINLIPSKLVRNAVKHFIIHDLEKMFYDKPNLDMNSIQTEVDAAINQIDGFSNNLHRLNAFLHYIRDNKLNTLHVVLSAFEINNNGNGDYPKMREIVSQIEQKLDSIRSDSHYVAISYMIERRIADIISNDSRNALKGLKSFASSGILGVGSGEIDKYLKTYKEIMDTKTVAKLDILSNKYKGRLDQVLTDIIAERKNFLGASNASNAVRHYGIKNLSELFALRYEHYNSNDKSRLGNLSTEFGNAFDSLNPLIKGAVHDHIISIIESETDADHDIDQVEKRVKREIEYVKWLSTNSVMWIRNPRLFSKRLNVLLKDIENKEFAHIRARIDNLNNLDANQKTSLKLRVGELHNLINTSADDFNLLYKIALINDTYKELQNIDFETESIQDIESGTQASIDRLNNDILPKFTEVMAQSKSSDLETLHNSWTTPVPDAIEQIYKHRLNELKNGETNTQVRSSIASNLWSATKSVAGATLGVAKVVAVGGYNALSYTADSTKKLSGPIGRFATNVAKGTANVIGTVIGLPFRAVSYIAGINFTRASRIRQHEAMKQQLAGLDAISNPTPSEVIQRDALRRRVDRMQRSLYGNNQSSPSASNGSNSSTPATAASNISTPANGAAPKADDETSSDADKTKKELDDTKKELNKAKEEKKVEQNKAEDAKKESSFAKGMGVAAGLGILAIPLIGLMMLFTLFSGAQVPLNKVVSVPIAPVVGAVGSAVGGSSGLFGLPINPIIIIVVLLGLFLLFPKGK